MSSLNDIPFKKRIFVVHGRDKKARDAIFNFLRDNGLHPLEWEEMVALTGNPSPHTFEVVMNAFSYVQAVVIIFSPDDLAMLRKELHEPDEDEKETKPQGQPRQNVLFEAGVAFSLHENRTIIIETAKCREMSDLQGMHVIRPKSLNNIPDSLLNRLRIAGCDLDYESPTLRTEAESSSFIFDLQFHADQNTRELKTIIRENEGLILNRTWPKEINAHKPFVMTVNVKTKRTLGIVAISDVIPKEFKVLEGDTTAFQVQLESHSLLEISYILYPLMKGYHIISGAARGSGLPPLVSEAEIIVNQ